ARPGGRPFPAARRLRDRFAALDQLRALVSERLGEHLPDRLGIGDEVSHIGELAFGHVPPALRRRPLFDPVKKTAHLLHGEADPFANRTMASLSMVLSSYWRLPLTRLAFGRTPSFS